jgi:predicted outer membrane repeat protein
VPHFLVLEDRTVLSTLTVLNNADSGAGSLRAAIAAAQSGDTIVFDPGLTNETITLTSGPLAISTNLAIDGLGADLLAISGDNASQLFTLGGSAQVTLSNLALTGGMSSEGGAILISGTASLTLDSDILSGNQAVGDTHGDALGGAVFNTAGASLSIDNTVFVNNQTNGNNNSFGGAIANGGSLTITGATFTSNVALGSTTVAGPTPGGSEAGAIGNLDGATAAIKLTAFTGNQALSNNSGTGEGGALCNGDGSIAPLRGVTCTLSQCTFTNNTSKGGSDFSSGGLYGGGAIEDNSGTNLAVLSCSFTGNQANNSGGAIAAGGAIDNSIGVTVMISDSLFINNSAIASVLGASAYGGALDNYQSMTIDNCLFTANSAMGGPMADGNASLGTLGQAEGGAIWQGGGLNTGVTAIFTLSNSIVAGNEAIGGSGGSTLTYPRTDGAFGGGIANLTAGTLNVAGCTIAGNQAIGGAVASGNGAPALGGGIDNNNQSKLNLTDSTVSTNLCQAGNGLSGSAGGVAAGGGIGNDRDSMAIITNCTISLNESLGGTGGAGAIGGAAVGGGIENGIYAYAWGVADASSLSVSSCALFGNMAQGGTGGSSALGGDGLGGGIFVGSGSAVLTGVLVSGNQSQGGADSQQNTTGQGLGGGVYVDPSATATEDMQTLIAGNQASKSNNDVWGTITMVP